MNAAGALAVLLAGQAIEQIAPPTAAKPVPELPGVARASTPDIAQLPPDARRVEQPVPIVPTPVANPVAADRATVTILNATGLPLPDTVIRSLGADALRRAAPAPVGPRPQ